MTSLRLLLLAIGLSLVATACGKRHENGDDDHDAAPADAEPCEGLGCYIVDCAAKGLPPTTISGTVYAPNGTLPLYGVNVYIPASDPGPLPEGAICDRCANGLPGGSWVSTRTDEAGHFQLVDVPATDNVPVIIQTGKWRKQLMMNTVAACQDIALTTAQTSLPKNKSEGDLPKIAITTGDADALECLPRKLGIDESEFTTNTGTGNLHLFAGEGGTDRFNTGFGGGTGTFPSATTLWGSVDELKKYDIVFFSCEGAQNPNLKPQSALDAVKAYADLGGRVFASHWHNIFIEGSTQGGGTQKPAVWAADGANPGVAVWNNSGRSFNSPPTNIDPTDHVDETSHPKGASFATWMMNVGASPAGMRGNVPITQGKVTVTSIDPAKAEQWVYLRDPPPMGSTTPTDTPQIFQFTTPNEADAQQRCGKVVFSDMHVSSGSSSRLGDTASGGKPYPSGCSTAELTPQEKALAFIFFDISSCVGVIQ